MCIKQILKEINYSPMPQKKYCPQSRNDGHSDILLKNQNWRDAAQVCTVQCASILLVSSQRQREYCMETFGKRFSKKIIFFIKNFDVEVATLWKKSCF